MQQTGTQNNFMYIHTFKQQQQDNVLHILKYICGCFFYIYL